MAPNNRKIIFDVKKIRGITSAELLKITKKWQSRLLLNEWDLSLKIVEFRRKDGFKQSGDIKVDLKNKKATLLLTSEPFKNEEEVIVHELIHLLLWDYDTFSERVILKNCQKFKGDHEKYMDKLEATVKNITDILIKTGE
jgi:hypothetical protein